MWHPGLATRRARLVEAMVQLAYERGFAGVSVNALCSRAQVSRRGFYALFASREECFLAVLDEGHRQASLLLCDAFAAEGPGGEQRTETALVGLRTALVALLCLLDEQPRLARVWLVESVTAGLWALERRERNVAALTEQIVGYWGGAEDPVARSLLPEGVMAAVLGLLQRHAVGEAGESFLELLGPLMGAVSAPYLGAEAVGDQIERARDLALRLRAERGTYSAGLERRLPRSAEEIASKSLEDVDGLLPAALFDPRAHRARGCVRFLAGHPGASNSQMADAVGVTSHAQISALLARLERSGLLCRKRVAPGHANAWRLTASGQHAATMLSDEGMVRDVAVKRASRPKEPSGINRSDTSGGHL